MDIEYVHDGAIISNEEVSFTYKAEDSIRDFDVYNRMVDSDLNWNYQSNYIGDYILHPFGTFNNLPTIIKDVVQKHYMATGLFERHCNLQWGCGPHLYTEDIVDNKVVRLLVKDRDIQSWLESWDYLTYLQKANVDFQHIQGFFTKFELNRGSRLGNSFIKKLEIIQPDKCRLASLKPNTPIFGRVPATHSIVNDWSFTTPNSLSNYKVYELFDYLNPFKSANSILYSNLYTFCTDYYTVPKVYGSIEWLNRSTAVPLIFKAMSKNSINLKYHVKSPQSFWDNRREIIQKNCEIANKKYNESMLEDYKTNFLKQIGQVLAGDDNTGKFLHTIKSIIIDGVNIKEYGWEIEVIDQKILDFVNAQIKISQRADQALSAGIGLHTSLGNVSETGKVDSGSEQYYALISYLNTSVSIPEMIVMKAINFAIKANWPDKDIKLGFTYNIPEKQQDITPKERMINNTPK